MASSWSKSDPTKERVVRHGGKSVRGWSKWEAMCNCFRVEGRDGGIVHPRRRWVREGGSGPRSLEKLHPRERDVSFLGSEGRGWLKARPK